MNRRKERERAFIFLFQNSFTGEKLEETIETAEMSEDMKIGDFGFKLFKGAYENRDVIDSCIERNIRGWKFNRLSKVAVNVLRIAVYEMLYEEDIPIEASINEAVELAKKYGTKDEPSYINGVLASVYREIKSTQENSDDKTANDDPEKQETEINLEDQKNQAEQESSDVLDNPASSEITKDIDDSNIK